MIKRIKIKIQEKNLFPNQILRNSGIQKISVEAYHNLIQIWIHHKYILEVHTVFCPNKLN